ncbi:hypothetical protein HY837_03375 [archaeon]|nr:hypothetical protein [archaeon]
MNLENYLQDLEEQKVVEETELKITNNPVLDLMCEIYEKWHLLGRHILPSSYDLAVKELESLKISAKDVKDFSIVLKKYEKDRYFHVSGVFLSALVNNCEDENVEVHTRHLKEKLSDIGFENVKDLTVIGDCGNWVGEEMIKGKIIVKGNTWGGTGERMLDGEIHVEGKIDNTGRIKGKGKIYCKGQLIADKSFSRY